MIGTVGMIQHPIWRDSELGRLGEAFSWTVDGKVVPT